MVLHFLHAMHLEPEWPVSKLRIRLSIGRVQREAKSNAGHL